MFTVYCPHVQRLTHLEKLFALPGFSICFDVKGQFQDLCREFVFAVSLDAGKVYFGARFPKGSFFDSSFGPGEFVEDLWKKDVAELFIARIDSSHYQELNLSPSGAWWSAGFSSYRKRSETVPCKLDSVEVFREFEGDNTYVAISMPWDLKDIEGGGLRVNMSSICHLPDARYFSLAAMSADKPDFHQTARFPRLRISHSNSGGSFS